MAKDRDGWAVAWAKAPAAGWAKLSAELMASLPPDDPGTVAARAFLSDPLWQGRSRVAVVRGSGRELGGLVVLGRPCWDRWLAAPWLLCPAAAPALAAAIDRSPAWGVLGPTAVLEPVGNHLHRVYRYQDPLFFCVTASNLAPFLARKGFEVAPVPGPSGLSLPVPDPRVRVAGPADEEAVMALMAARGYDYMPTRYRARHYLRELLGRGRVLVGDSGGKVAGVIWSELRAARWEMWGGLRVHPRAWAQRLSWALVTEAMRRSEEAGRSFCATLGPANTMVSARAISEHPDATRWYLFILRPPTRLPGQRALRAVLERAEGRRPNALTP